ncbi:MAG TPA: hypothetical protein DCE52_13715 [Rhodobacteraceae bacterium]|nr:hypothetical protein [Paracoccaceae bacterium]
MTDAYQVIPLTPLRKIIAARMTQAKQSSPHYRVGMDIDMDALLALRQQYNTDNLAADNGIKISVNDFIIKACATTLMAMPALNIQFIDGEIHQYPQADISVVIAVEGGLSTPVICDANNKTVQTIAKEIKALAARAQSGTLKMDEILGGTFSISNLGMYGVDQFDAIINPPQCAILAIGSARPQPIIKAGEITSATVMRATLSLDHRVIDGATGAQFLSILREQLQHPEGLLA